MSKIKVIIKDKYTLQLCEDAKENDIIDLRELSTVDLSYVEKIINEGLDKKYEDKLKDKEELLKVKYDAKIKELQDKINAINDGINDKLALNKANIEKEYIEKLNSKQKEIDELVKKHEKEKLSSEYQIKELNSNLESKLNEEKAIYDNKYKDKVNELNNKITKLENEKELVKLQTKEAAQKEIDELKTQINQKDIAINELKRAKAAMNVKQIGEDLETWCDEEVKSYMQNGLFNCTWIKDNEVIKNDGETKGSKADYIFNIYSDSTHSHLLANCCLEMKDENPDSVNKKQDDTYFKQLDKNREKKNCKYALLVSNLESGRTNILPIYKVREYENMYVVRPAYMMIFLNMLTSLTTRFQDIIINNDNEELKLKTKIEILESFEKIKDTYLDKPLELLKKSLEDITKSTEQIKKASNKIDETCDKIKSSYINEITEKLNKFEIKLNKDIKNID